MGLIWHLLQISDVLDIEFGSALAERVPLLAWEPRRILWPFFLARGTSQIRHLTDPPLTIRTFSLLTGYARLPISLFARTGSHVRDEILQVTDVPKNSPLICTTPYLAPVASRWPGPVVYWLTDRIERYRGANASLVHRLDREMCTAATLVCPNSLRLAEYLKQWGRCSEEKVHILPNATRKSNLLPKVPSGPSPQPKPIASLRRPIAGVIGNLAGNMDWLFLEALVQKTAAMNWVFVGPTSMPIDAVGQRAARSRVMTMERTHFVGKQEYGELASYARSFDVAVLPYLRGEPTYSGSSTRFYEHLAACRPMIATRGFEELTRKEPLLRLVEDADDAAKAIDALKACNFEDGLSEMRWQASQDCTWQVRAEEMRSELARRL